MKEGLIALSYECAKCNDRIVLYEQKSVVLDGFEWRCRKKGVNMNAVRNRTSHYEVYVPLLPRRIYMTALTCHSLSKETFKYFFLKSIVTLYPPLGNDQQYERYLVAAGIEPRSSGLKSDALTTRLPTGQDFFVRKKKKTGRKPDYNFVGHLGENTIYIAAASSSYNCSKKIKS
ncbi:hypothetical protein TNCV_2236401 [Trichonephila clavipes]|nr:hypothetical protein TNCV_2236401 [Trichonephila clavipes]